VFAKRLGRHYFVSPFLLAILLSCACGAAERSADRIAVPIDDTSVTRINRGVHPLIRMSKDIGRVNAFTRLERVKLVFQPSATQKKELELLLEQQLDPNSPNYHKWLTPAEFADRFGLSRADTQRVAAWLRIHGFRIAEIAPSRTYIAVNGVAAQFESAFHTQIHHYVVDGALHFANVTAPSIPSALTGIVAGISSLNNFAPKPQLVRPRPQVTSSYSGSHFMQPADFATIYNLRGLYQSGINGSGQTIAVVGESDLVGGPGNYTDVIKFRANSGLSAPHLTSLLIPNTTDPGVVSGDIDEANLDVEWAGGVAPNANILYVIGNGHTAGGSFDALVYAVNQNLAPVISVSYDTCEPFLDSATQTLLVNAGMQANAQGQTIVVASGDSGGAGCDYNNYPATHGLAVDFPASMPYATAVGGTEFFPDPAGLPYPNCVPDAYWGCSTGGVADTSATALGYISETVWNDSSTDQSMAATGGGLSVLFSQPSWQGGLQAITNGMRGVPDISFSASADHDGYLICSQGSCSCGFRNSCTITDTQGTFDAFGGTSASAPAFAALVALINQKTGTRQGNLNPILYSMGSTVPGAFHDVSSGDNQVQCTYGTKDCLGYPYLGYYASSGYDLATGLGSVDATALVTAWNTQISWALTVGATFWGTVTSADGLINCGSACKANYADGTVVTLNATPAYGFMFSGWSGACTGTGSCVVTMHQPQSVQASFDWLVYTLTVTENGNGVVSSSDNYIYCPAACSAPYYPGWWVTLTASPAQGWAFTGWNGCDSVQGNVCTVTMNNSRTVTASFLPLYSLSVSMAGSGFITSADGYINCGAVCAYSYIAGSAVALTATAAQGWSFTGWSGCDSVQGAVCAVAMSNVRNVAVTFSPLYPLTVSIVGSGTITSADGLVNCGAVCSYAYIAGSAVVLTATPTQGWVFSGWSGCDSVQGNVCQVAINSARNVTAMLTPQYQLSVISTGGGSVSSADGYINCGSLCSHIYLSGTSVMLTAAAKPGWGFASWSGCDATNGSACAVRMNNPRTIVASFLPIFPLTVSTIGEGTVISGDGHINCGSSCSYSYLYGTTLAVTALPAVGYSVSGWSGCVSVQTNVCTATLNGPAPISVTFTAASPTITSVTFSPATVRAGKLAVGSLSFGSVTPSGGITIGLTSSQPSSVVVPSILYVPGGVTSFRFVARAISPRPTSVTISATDGTSTAHGVIDVLP